MELSKKMDVRSIQFPASLKVDDCILFVDNNMLHLGTIANFDMDNGYPSLAIGYMVDGKHRTLVEKLSGMSRDTKYRLVVLVNP